MSTRTRIQRVALDLFERDGYDATTVDQVAHAVGVSHMTVFRHFPTKAALVVEDPFDPRLAQAVAAQPTTMTPVSRACAGIRAALSAVEPSDLDDARRRIRIIAATDSLQPAAAAATQGSQQALAQALLTDPKTGPFAAQVAAASVMAALAAALTQWATGDADHDFAAIANAALDIVDPQ